MRNAVAVVVVTAGLFSSHAVLGDELFRYTYVQADYAQGTSEVRGYSQKSDLWSPGAAGSYALTDNLSLRAAYAKTRASFTPPGISSTWNEYAQSLRLDLHGMVSDSSELGLFAARHRVRATNTLVEPAFNINRVTSMTNYSDSWGVRGRTAIVPDFRLSADVARNTGGQVTTTDYGAGAQYELTQNFEIGTSYDLITTARGNTRWMGVAGRYYF